MHIIEIENLSKKYRLGYVGVKTLADDINRFFAGLRGREDPTLKIGQAPNSTPNSQLPTPNFQLPTPNSQLPTPQLPTPNSQLPTPNSQLPTPNSQLPTHLGFKRY